MSFGKDQGQLANIPAFGGNYIQKAKTQARRIPSGGGGGGFHWKGNYRPPEHTSDTVRLIPGKYLQEVTHDEVTIVQEEFPFAILREHTSKQGNTTRTSMCSAGPLYASILGLVFRGEPSLAQPCHCCSVWAEDVKVRHDKKQAGDDSKGPNRMQTRDQFAFNCWDYGLYFEVPDTDKNGQPRMNTRTNQPYTSWVKGNPNNPAMQGRPWRYGNLAPWYMGKTHKETLINYGHQVIGRMCKTCGTRESIVTVAKICGNPQCGQYIYDPSSTTLTEEQQRQIDFYPYNCKYCGHTGYVEELIECNNPNCNHPERSTIFDVDLVVQRMKSGDGRQTNLQILNFSEPRPIQVQDPEVLKTIQPLDLLKKFAPTPLDQQLKLHGLTAVQPPQQQQQQPPMPVGAPPMGAPPMQHQGYPPPPAQQPSAMMGMGMGSPAMAPPPVGIPQQPPMQQQQYAPPPMQQPPPPMTQQPLPLTSMPAVPYQAPPQGTGNQQ